MKKNGLAYCKNSGFQAPEGYFETLEDRLMERLARSEEHFELPSQAGFEVPDDYFISLEQELMEKVSSPKKQSKLISLFNREIFYYAAGVAAVLVAVLTNVNFQRTEVYSLENIDLVTMESYIDESIDYSTPEISQMFSEAEISLSPSNQPSNVDHEAVLEYLHENIEEPTLIFNDN